MSSSKSLVFNLVLLAAIIIMCALATAGKRAAIYILIVLIAGVILENIIIYRRLIRSDWRCEKCGTVFKPKASAVLFAINAGDVKIMRCPHCESKQDCKPIENEEKQV